MMLKQLLFSAAVATVAISASAESKVLWQSEDPEGDPIAGWNTFYEMTAEEAAVFNAGDVIYMTITAKGTEGWPQVAIFEGGVGWPPFANAGAGDAFPKKATMTLTPDAVEAVHANGISFRGESVYVSEIGYETSTFEVNPNAVWIGPKECGWGDPASVAKEVFADVKVGDQIVVEYDTKFEGMNVNLKFNGWGACSINIGAVNAGAVDFITNDQENGIITITLTEAAENFNWADGDNPAQDWNLLDQLKENGFMVQGPSIINQIIYIPSTGNNSELEAANKAAYDEVVAQLDELQAKYDAAVNEIKETNPDFDFTEWEEIGNMIEQYKGWALQALESANEDGTEFNFPFDGEEIDAYITMMAMAGKPAPAFPESFNVTLSNTDGVEVNQYIEQEVYTISVSGKSEQEELTLTLTVPDGWDGFLCQTESPEVEPLSTRAEVTEWWPVADLLEFGATESNSMTFPVDGEEHFGQFLLVKDGMADVANHITVEFTVEKANDITAANQAAYEEVVAKIEALQKEYEEALKEAEEANPDYDFAEWKEIIGGGLNQLLEGAKQALDSANEDGEAFQFAFESDEVEAMIAEMKKAPLLDANQAAYDEVVAKIDALKKGYEEALKEATEEYPDYDFSEWETMINESLNEASEGAEKALYSANEDGEAFFFPFTGEDVEGMIAEMKKAPIVTENQKAYEQVVASINDLKAKYEAALKEAEEANPDYDFSEWETMINESLNEASEGAEKALYSANEDGEAFFFPFTGEDVEGMIAEMKKAPIVSENYEAYDKVMAEIEAVKAEYEKAVSDITTEYPEFDITEMKGIIENAISEAETGAEQALNAANEEGEAFFFPFSTEEIENMIAQMKEEAATSGINGVNAADEAIYFDLDGHRINNPEAGMYVKVVNGKATKVVIKK